MPREFYFEAVVRIRVCAAHRDSSSVLKRSGTDGPARKRVLGIFTTPRFRRYSAESDAGAPDAIPIDIERRSNRDECEGVARAISNF